MPHQNPTLPHHRTKFTPTCLTLTLVAAWSLLCLTTHAHAAIIATGNILPNTDPTTWTSGTQVYIGYSNSDGTLNITDGSELSTSTGTVEKGTATVDGVDSLWMINSKFQVGDSRNGILNITGGGTITSREGIIGNQYSSTGKIVVDGTGSKWVNNSSFFYVGQYGNGTLNITNGGMVSNKGGIIGYRSNSTGHVTVDGTGSTFLTSDFNLVIGHGGTGFLDIINNGLVVVEKNTMVSDSPSSSGKIYFDNGTLTTGGLIGTFEDISGTGTINTHGLVSDIDLIFDATHGLNQVLYINKNADQNLTINLNATGSGAMGAGYSGHGSLEISDGRAITSTRGYIGYKSSSVGEVTVDGVGSTWIVKDYYFKIGYGGNGTLNIFNGGTVKSAFNVASGVLIGSTSEINIDGINSTWETRQIQIGSSGNSTLNITNGGMLASTNATIANGGNSTSAVLVDGSNSTWNMSSVISANNQYLYIGKSGNGTLNITNGGNVSNSHGYIGYIGYESGSTGKVTVDGTDSSWISSIRLHIGYEGKGSLHITGGGSVINRSSTIGYVPYETNEVIVDGIGSTWTNNGDLTIRGMLNITNNANVTVTKNTQLNHAGNTQTIHFKNGTLTTGSFLGNVHRLTGTGVINTGGLVCDLDLVFDTTHGLNQTFHINNNPNQNITINLNVDSASTHGAGYYQNGSMTISDGRVITSTQGYIGYNSDSTGVVTVDGIGSEWNIRDSYSTTLYVGHYGSGTLNIINGGKVQLQDSSHIGRLFKANGVVNVDGVDSAWTIEENLTIGSTGNNKSSVLNITNGGLVSIKGALDIRGTNDNYGVINMTSGGMLALEGKSDHSIYAFLYRIEGFDTIRYWNDSIDDWDNITHALYDQDYTLAYFVSGDLAGYTVLTVSQLSTTILGDINGDGLVDGFDVDPFVEVLLWGPYQVEADMNQDGDINGYDVDPFVTMVLGGASNPQGIEIPEPTTLAMLGLVSLVAMRRRK